jgi:prophage regulatory protein
MPEAKGLPHRSRNHQRPEEIMNQVIERRTDAILRLPQVRQLTGLGRSSIYALQESRAFPHSVKLSPRAVGWLESEIREWIHSRTQLRGSQASELSPPVVQGGILIGKRRVVG